MLKTGQDVLAKTTALLEGTSTFESAADALANFVAKRGLAAELEVFLLTETMGDDAEGIPVELRPGISVSYRGHDFVVVDFEVTSTHPTELRVISDRGLAFEIDNITELHVLSDQRPNRLFDEKIMRVRDTLSELQGQLQLIRGVSTAPVTTSLVSKPADCI